MGVFLFFYLHFLIINLYFPASCIPVLLDWISEIFNFTLLSGGYLFFPILILEVCSGIQ